MWLNAVVAEFALFFWERDFWMVLVLWLIDWLFFVEINLFLELKVFEKKKMTVIFVFLLVEKETSFENNELIKLELVKQTKIKSCCFDGWVINCGDEVKWVEVKAKDDWT